MVREIEGVVVEGDRRGRELGYPTANLALAADVELEDGVYAGSVELEDGTTHRAAVSVGRRPTYYTMGERLAEAYLLDFDRDLYGQKVRVVIRRFLRPQRAYATQAELIEQMVRDVDLVRLES